MVEMDDVASFLSRSFCILEVFATMDGKANFLPILDLVRANNMEQLLATRPVKVEEAETRSGRSCSCIRATAFLLVHTYTGTYY